MNSVSGSNSDSVTIQRYLDMLWMERGLSDNTLAAYRRDLQQYALWLSENNRSDISLASAVDLQQYLGVRLRAGSAQRSAARLMSSIRGFYQFLLREGLVDSDPSRLIDSPRQGRPLPKSLSEQEVDRLLDAPDIDNPIECRDRAMLELLYATGLRVTELVTLKISQVSLNQGVVRVIGKGSKERLVPMGEEAQDWISTWLRGPRLEILGGIGSDVLFPSKRGREMTRQTFWYRIKIYASRAGIQTHLSPHTLRHAFATHLINHGADLRVVQMLLGHSDLTTTQIYTHVARTRMQALHEQHHPRG